MNMMILGNCISLGASICLAASCCAKSRESAYRLQAAESGVLCVSYLVFNAWAGLITQVLSVIRNLLVVRGKYTARLMVVFTVLAVALGVALVNAFQWLAFSFCIGDYVNTCTQVVVMTLCVVSLVRLRKRERQIAAA